MSSHLDVASQITRLKAHLANIRSTSHVWSTEAGFHLVCVRVGGDIGKVYEAGRVVKPLLGASVSTTTTSPPERATGLRPTTAKTGKNRPWTLPGLRRYGFLGQGSIPVSLSIRITTLKNSGRSLISTAHPIPEARPHPHSEAVKMDVFTEFRRGKTIENQELEPYTPAGSHLGQ